VNRFGIHSSGAMRRHFLERSPACPIIQLNQSVKQFPSFPPNEDLRINFDGGKIIWFCKPVFTICLHNFDRLFLKDSKGL